MTESTMYFIVDEDGDAIAVTDVSRFCISNQGCGDEPITITIDVVDDDAATFGSAQVKLLLGTTERGVYEVDTSVIPGDDGPLVKAVRSANRAIRKAMAFNERKDIAVSDIL